MAIGSYAVERDYSHYVAYAAKTIFAVVGTATKGPVGVATVCTSAQDLVNKFGPLKPNCLGLYAGQYFLSQSSKLYFVRAASRAIAGAKAIVKGVDAQSTEVLDSITFEILDPGTYYNGYKLYISKKTVTEVVNETEDVKITTITETPDSTGKILSNTVEITRKKIVGEEEGTTSDIYYTLEAKSGLGTILEVIKDIPSEELLNSAYSTEYIKVSNFNTTTVSLSPSVYEFTGGRDGILDKNVTLPKLDAEGNPTTGTEVVPEIGVEPGDYINAAQALVADTVDMNLFAVPGVSDSAVITAMLELAENRGDTLYLVDPPKGLTRDGVAAWHNASGSYNVAGRTAFDSSYGALYYDWVTIYDSINKVKVDVPPSVPVAASIAYSDRISEPWYAPAGLTRGLVRGVLGSITKLGKNDVSYLYEGNNNINSIYDDPQVGLALWGQKTLSRANTALNRVNVRRLMNYLKKIVTAACDYLTFDPNDRVTWNSFEMKVLPVLESIKNRRGIYEYRVLKGETIVTNEDIDNYRMPCMIMIRPTKAAEEIPIYFVITSTGADFNEVLEANGIITI